AAGGAAAGAPAAGGAAAGAPASGGAEAAVLTGLGLAELARSLRAAFTEGATAVELEVPDPDAVDAGGATAAGPVAGRWRGWFDLAEGLGCRLEAPRPLGGGRAALRLVPLPPEADWHGGAATAGAGDAGGSECYADPEGFGAVRKLDHPGFLLPLLEALERVRPPDGGRVLVLGCHRGDEVAAFGLLDRPPVGLDVVGVDHAESPLAEAARRFPTARFLRRDVADLPSELGRFDLVVAIAVLQSPAVDDRALLRRLVQAHLTPAGALLLGLPNGRFRGHEPVWGARTRNYREPDLSLVVRDLAAYRRYLHQHGFRAHVGGRYDLLLSAWRGARPG
ncbi:MAG: class I SAM-dependent methyltransferase, partial [Trueperaceae bacterium]